MIKINVTLSEETVHDLEGEVHHPTLHPFLRSCDTATLVKNLSKMAENSTRITMATTCS